MKKTYTAVGTLTVLLCGSLLAASPAAPSASGAPGVSPQSAPLAPETLTIAKVGAKNPHWVYVLDEALLNEIDSRVYLFDGDSHRRIGQLGAGFMPGMNLSPDGRTTVVATSYFSRGGHGTRTDVVEFNDNSTLAKSAEVVLPTKRVATLPTHFNVAYSSDGHFVYTAYVTPAASFGVLDAAKKSVLSEIDTAGCVLVIPSGPNRVSSICESGRLLTVTLDAGGHEKSRSTSEVFFDPDTDPVFVQGIPMSSGYAFLSFHGIVHEVDFSGAQPVFRPTWSLLTKADEAWRPGGTQIGSVHRSLGRLYVSMHKGGDGTHKDGGTEVWVFDLKTHQRMARWPLDVRDHGAVQAVLVSQDDAPVLFTARESSDLAILDARDGHLRYVEKHLGQSPWLMFNP
jgi:methylamine dehydrogenase heavy chain